MPKYRVRYTGQWDYEVEADDQFEAEEAAKDQSRDSWIAEEIEE